MSGVLLGADQYNQEELQFSEKVFKIFKKKLPQKSLALDCGAGVGRVTEAILVKHFDQVDLIEPAKNMLDIAKAKFGKKGKVRQYYQKGL